MGLRHADEIEEALSQGALGHLRGRDPAGVHQRQRRHRAKLLHEREPLPLGPRHGAVVERAVAAGDAHIVDEAARFETPDDPMILLDRHPALLHVVQLQPHAENHLRPDCGAHGLQRLHEEPHPILQRTAILVGPQVPVRIQHLRVQKALVRVNLHAVHPARRKQRRCPGNP